VCNVILLLDRMLLVLLYSFRMADILELEPDSLELEQFHREVIGQNNQYLTRWGNIVSTKDVRQ